MDQLDGFPTIKSVGPLQTMLQNYRNYQLVCGSRVDPGNATGGITTTKGVMTTRLSYIPAQSANMIILVYVNYNGGDITGSTGLGENPGTSVVRVTASIEYDNGSNSGPRTQVTFNGEVEGEIPVNGMLYSDPVPYVMVKGTRLFVRTGYNVPGSGYTVPQGATPQGGTGAGSVNNGDGTSTSGNFVMGTGVIGQTTGNGGGPVAILGYVSKKIPTVGLFGDSINEGYQDGGYSQNGGGYLQRAIEGQLALTYQYPVTPNFPYVKTSRSGETLSAFLTILNTQIGSGNVKRLRVIEMGSTIITELGTNDLPSSITLSALQALYLQNANVFLAMDKKFIACTLLPRTTSTDGFLTTANQTQYSYEAVRQAFNSWLRDTSSAGFIAMTVNPAMTAIFDAAAAVEVNSANVLTLNGGYWQISPNGGTALDSGTISSNASSITLSDSTKTWTQDQWRGYVVQITSGSAQYQQSTIWSNSATELFAINIAPNAPSVGETYKIYQSYTAEGTHPTSLGYMTIAQTFPLNLIV